MADNKKNIRKDRFTAQEDDFYFVDDPPKKKAPTKPAPKKPTAPKKTGNGGKK